jgi:hypothetical protein
MQLVSIPVEFIIDAGEDPMDFLDVLLDMPWLTYLKQNSIDVQQNKHYDARLHRSIVTYCFQLPEELASFYYLAYS